MLAALLTVGVGFIIIVKVFVGPAHEAPPFAKVGVTTIVRVTGEVPAFVAVKAGMSPVPLDASPCPVRLFVQL